jgi:hypothetical protein
MSASGGKLASGGRLVGAARQESPEKDLQAASVEFSDVPTPI